MIQNYLLIAVRNLRKHVGYSTINVIGLSLGLTTCLLLVTWIRHEISYDKFHEKADRLYRVSLEYSFGGQSAALSVSPTALLPALKELPEVENGVRLYNPSAYNSFIVQHGDQTFSENHFYAADSSFFKIFSYPLISGNPDQVLRQPYSVAISESTAQKYFGDTDALGKTIRVNNNQDYIITGVFADMPSNSLYHMDLLTSFHSFEAGRGAPIWWSANYQTFVVLREGSDPLNAQSKINEVVLKALAGQAGGPSDFVRYNFMLMKDIYLYSKYEEAEVVSNIRYIYIFSAIAILILFIACINYINLSTARAAERAKEVGIRKVVGALKNQLLIQFIGESVVITFAAFCIAFVAAQSMLPIFNEVSGKSLPHQLMLTPSFILLSLVILLFIALLAGAYPAFAITAFTPSQVLKGSFKTSAKGIWLRQSLVVFQFGISVVLIMGTIIITKQLQYLQSTNLGYNRENVIVLPLDRQTEPSFQSLKTEWLSKGLALEVARGSESPVQIQGGYSIKLRNNDGPGMITTGLIADEGYIPAMGMSLVAGRNFTPDDIARAHNDTLYAFIVNESGLKALYVDINEAVGTVIDLNGRNGEIIGVVKDFHFSSLHTVIGPLTIFPEDSYNKLFVKLPKGDVSEQLKKLESSFKTIVASRPFEFQFVDQQYQALYQNEVRMGSVFTIFATLAIVIACLGLIGLVAFSAAQKTKEIGIRKVMGATAPQIVILLTRNYSKLVLLAIVISIPLSYWMMTTWLTNFAYQTEIGVWPSLIASAIAITTALGVSSYQAIKAAVSDPVRTLKNE